ncbi:BRO-like protein [Enterovibrio norvegicus]|uniref:BRO-N domain-containing protein n=1 Tax=Enterovibrio norvegicus TaxID=188144 RepID=UPI000C851A29|nr:BRO family protein [Enterovibrio norvegicus]MCC4797219.1 BRO-like protein [Enterovibrio norvegicus]PMI26949.1 BRO-like protein [Enterovibrio norvegicus]PMI40068.1 BRO-like protein [Enterovibrio norvegicus]PMN56173.1 BRO-like protein [Enterovibrio norvegicus]TKF08694.1 BRO-like protein [Enterovibrio norvegicus]
MNNELMNICYEGDFGASDIRTCNFDKILYISLRDVMITLTKENNALDDRYASKHIPNLIKSQLAVLDDDEYILLPAAIPTFKDEKEVFITQPGLNRVMASDKSKAGKRFQRWLYHEVIPSLIKHGTYPPPITPQGSALSQMAEILAQNSRALANAIVRQDKLEADVADVKSDVNGVELRVSKLEERESKNRFILPVRQLFDEVNQVLSEDKEFEIVTWCENLSLSHGKQRIACPSGERLNAQFHREIIEEAKNLVEMAQG